MAKKIKIGNGYVAPLSYEIIERTEDSRTKAIDAAKKEKWDIDNMTPEELLKRSKKYYQTQLAEE